MSTSDSDAEFYDAEEELGSPRTSKPPVSVPISVPEVKVEEEKVESKETEVQNAAPACDETSNAVEIPSVSTVPKIEETEVENAVLACDETSNAIEIPSVPTVHVVEENTDEQLIAETSDEILNQQEDEPDGSGVQVKESLQEKSDEVHTVVSQPDLLACAQERPTDLPGVKPVDVIVHPPEVAEPLSSGDNSAKQQPEKKRPPPRPPAPPKRPPPPRKYLSAKAGQPGKPYLSLADDGLLTPNSTVDNLTREFTEALNQAKTEDKKQERPVLPQENEHGHSKVPQPNASSTRDSVKSETNSTGRPSSSNLHTHSSKSNSLGRKDEEILSHVIVKNLDTGESMPLSAAAEQVSQCLNPLDLQIMSRTKEFSYAGSNNSSANESQTGSASAIRTSYIDSDSVSIASDDIEIGKEGSSHKHHDGARKLKMKSKKLKKFVGKGMSKVKVAAGTKMEKAVQKAKHMKEEVMHQETLNVSSDEDSNEPGSASAIKVKASSSNKGPYQFSRLKQVQDIAVHVGAVWCMKFSHCGRLLATAGQDNVIWVWVLRDFYDYFNDMRNKYDSKEAEMFGPSHRQSMHLSNAGSFKPNTNDDVFDQEETPPIEKRLDEEEDDAPFRQVPFSSYVGHSADVLDLAWSKNFFILSSSMDKTVRLWHISRKECLCCFQHIDFVTAIAFHPRDDRYFLSGSLDSKLRLWNIPDKKVALWNEVAPDGSSSSSGGPAAGGALITTVNFCENGKFAVCGTYDGRCIFFDTEHLKYHTQIHVRSSRGRNNKGHKITGIEPLQGEHKILVTSNDSRVRLYDLRDLSLSCKYKGHTNLSSQIKASFSPDSKYIICGSEDKCVYIWKTSLPQDVMKMSSFRRDRNDSWESLKAHDAVVTCAVFAPQPHLLYKPVCESTAQDVQRSSKTISILSLTTKKQPSDEVNVIISADFNGEIKVIVSGG